MGLQFIQEGENVNHTPASALYAGDPIRLADGRVGVAVTDIPANTTGALRVCGIFEGDANSSDTWNKGDDLVWDYSASKIIKKSLVLDGSADLPLGPAQAAKTNGQTRARAQLNGAPLNQGVVVQELVFEFDCETGVDAATHVFVPAEKNPFGFVLLHAFALVTEAFGGASEDQGIVTIEDTDGTDLCTLTPSNAGADATGDMVIGTKKLLGGTTGDAAGLVAAGKGVRGVITQATSGAGAAGKMKVYILLMPLL